MYFDLLFVTVQLNQGNDYQARSIMEISPL